MRKVKRITIPGFIVTLRDAHEPLELCDELGNTLTEASKLKRSRLLIGDSFSVFCSRPLANAAIRRTELRATKEGTLFNKNILKVVRLIRVPS